LLSYLSNLFI